MNGTTATALRHSISGVGVGDAVPVATLVVYKDDKGYGMKVSGDKPVYVQSVKEGGAAARAGLHAGDKIIKVNGVNVMQSTHTDVVELIKSATSVVLTVQQKSVNMATGFSPSQHHRPTSLSTGSMHVSNVQGGSTSLHRASTAPASCNERITGPQPVDHEKKRQMENQRILTLQLMLENEKSHVDKLRSELAKAVTGASNYNNTVTLQNELTTAERRLTKVQEQLDQFSPSANTPNALACGGGDTPPPLPSRKSLTLRSLSPPPLPPRPLPNSPNVVQSEQERQLTSSVGGGIPNSFSQGSISGNKHQRAKSSPDQLGIISPAEASRRLIASETSTEAPTPGPRPGTRLSGIDLDDPPGHRTPPGTPPPPYPAPVLGDVSAINESILDNFNAMSSPRSQNVLDGSNSGLPMIQQPIMSMEDDDMSDQEVGQLEDHGPFKILSKLWQHHAHLAVFINYVFSNSDPSSLLFYLITDQYKEGNAKEMKKWAYEIHSTFLVPGAPLRLNNVDEKIAREIDDDLHKESDKEEKLRMIFHKARKRAKEELNEQLADFQQKRIAGLGTLFGPTDAQLDESTCDKSRETKIVETYLLPKMETYLEDIEKENVDQRKFATAASLATVLTKVFQVRPITLDRVPTFVAKDKSQFKARLSAGKARKMTIRGHHFVAHQYYNLIYCNHCQTIIGGIGPQGYQCGNCSFNVHRQCVKIVEENCPGPLVKKEKGNDRISKLMEHIRREKKPPSHHHNQNHAQMHHIERMKREQEESNPSNDHENGEHQGRGQAGSARGGSERGRVSGFGGSGDHADSMDDPSSREDVSEITSPSSSSSSSLFKFNRSNSSPTKSTSKISPGSSPSSRFSFSSSPTSLFNFRVQNIASKPKTSNINRSESYKERIHNRKQLREKRKTSDPNLSKTNDCDGSGAFPGNSAGSSSNSSLSTRSLDSPSTSLEQVHPNSAGAAAHASSVAASASWDSDVDVEPDTPDWSVGVPEDVLASLTNSEKKRQEVINELFHTERSHVRALKVLSQVFHRPMVDTQLLPANQIELLFSNLDEMVTLHSKFNQSMKLKKKENPHVGDVGELLLDMFDGDNGEVFEKAASKYCAKQQVALRSLRDKRSKDPKLNSFLNEVEANPMCRRLQLKDHILTGMLRLTKYPLLFDNLAKYTPEQNEKERAAVLRALERSREILSRVNQAVREAEDYHRLVEIQKTIDRAAFDRSAFEKCETVKCESAKCESVKFEEIKNLDVTKRRLIYEGPLQWRLPKAKPVDLHVVLLDDTILLLHRQDDKYALKLLNQNQNSVLSPIVKVSTVLVRHNAVDKHSLYLVNTSHHGAQIYDLVAPSSEERKLWYKHITEATEAIKADKEGRRPMPQSSSSDDLIESPEDQLLPETPQAGPAANASAASAAATTTQTESTNDARASDKSEQDKRKKASPSATTETSSSVQQQKESQSAETSEVADSGTNADEVEGTNKDEAAAATATNSESTTDDKKREEVGVATSATEPVRLVTCTQTSLVDPVEVHVEERPVHVAEPVLTPIETIRRKDEIIKQALADKLCMVADVLNISKTNTEEIAETETVASPELLPKELIKSVMGQVSSLFELMSSALTVSETDTVLATQSASAVGGCEATGCPAPRVFNRTSEPAIPVSLLQPVCNTLTSQLTELLKIVKEWDEDRERMRKELHRSRERLHAIDAEAQRRETLEPSSSLTEAVSQNQQTTLDNQEMENQEPNKEVTPETQNKVEVSETAADLSGEMNLVSENEVMGDSVG